MLPPNRMTPNIVDLQYSTSTQAGQQLDKHFELQIRHRWYITTYSRTTEMSTLIVSLKVTWSTAVAMRIETVKSYRLDKKANKQHSKLSDSTNSWLTSRAIPEEMPVLVTGSLCCMRYLCLSLSLSCVRVSPGESMCGDYTRRKRLVDSVSVLLYVWLAWHWPIRCDFCLKTGNWPSQGLCSPLL